MLTRLSEGVTQEGMFTRCWISGAKGVRSSAGKSTLHGVPRPDGEAFLAEVTNPTLPGKASSESQLTRTANRHWWTG